MSTGVKPIITHRFSDDCGRLPETFPAPARVPPPEWDPLSPKKIDYLNSKQHNSRKTSTKSTPPSRNTGEMNEGDHFEFFSKS